MYQKPIIFICHFIWDKIGLYQRFIFCLNSEQIKNVACYKYSPRRAAGGIYFIFLLINAIFFISFQLLIIVLCICFYPVSK